MCVGGEADRYWWLSFATSRRVASRLCAFCPFRSLLWVPRGVSISRNVASPSVGRFLCVDLSWLVLDVDLLDCTSSPVVCGAGRRAVGAVYLSNSQTNEQDEQTHARMASRTDDQDNDEQGDEQIDEAIVTESVEASRTESRTRLSVRWTVSESVAPSVNKVAGRSADQPGGRLVARSDKSGQHRNNSSERSYCQTPVTDFHCFHCLEAFHTVRKRRVGRLTSVFTG